MTISRRDVLALGAATAAASLIPRAARALGKDSQFRFGELGIGTPTPRPMALRRMAWEIEKRTSIVTDTTPKSVTLADEALHETPFLVLAGNREFAIPAPAQIEKLRAFLTFGGFLLIDSAEGTTEGAFDGSVRQLIEAIYPPPASGLEVVPKDHVVYKSFYLIDSPVGRLAISGAMEGVFRDGRLVIAYVQNDLGGAWARDSFGNHEFQCEPGGERQREVALRVGINLVMYALCLDYKTDQVHVPFIMRRRRWRPNDGAETP